MIRMRQDMRHIAKTIIVFVLLLMSATMESWASETKIIGDYKFLIDKLPNDEAGSVNVAVSGTTVTLTVTPATDYYVNKNTISAEPMVDLPQANVPHHVSVLDAFTVNGSGTSYTFDIGTYKGAHITVRFYQKTAGISHQISSLADLQAISGSDSYELVCDIDASGFTTISSFSGILTAQAKEDGTFPVILNLSCPLFTTATDATISNIILDKVSISQAGIIGSIACTANGTTSIYNCGILSGSVGSTGTSTADNSTDCCGGLVGFLDGTARVINCYSYATITGGNRVGGIVGYNNYQTTSAADKLKTMVMNCMFYGDITGGFKKAPIYHGKKINNIDAAGVGNYNYFSAEASYVKNNQIDMYYCALMAETRFLQRFEFYRYLLNSHRELAAWWATGDRANKDLMAKWVLEPSQIGSDHPYPILKAPNKQYPSVVNFDAKNAVTKPERNKGGKLGTLTVNIQKGNGGAQFNNANATITTSQLTLNITDKDYDHFNYNYYKVQLPYYNDVGTGNYTGNRVVTGWKIVKINDSADGTGSYSTGNDVSYDEDGNMITPYNFADRNSTKKDLYGKSNRVFNQGAYWDVPEGVTEITIEPYWAKAAYIADAYADVVYNASMTTPYNVPNVGGGQIYTNGVSTFNGDDNQKVYTNTLKSDGTIDKTAIANALTVLSPNNKHTVYDYAVVLVGNYHQYNNINNSDKPYTVTSVDLDHDNEPDYSFMLRFDGRTKFHPVKYDFLNLVGLGMAQKSTSSKGSYNFGIPQPKYWFEVTNTALFRVTQMEYSPSDRVKKPIIMQGGVIEQWVTQQQDAGDKVEYFHVGSNVWFKEFHRGSHQDNAVKSPSHPPLSVTGGDFEKFYLTGAYQPLATNYDDDAECYINGGRFGIVAGAGMDGIGNEANKTNGNVVWQIDNADINEFYGGGINGEKPIQGNITTVIRNSHVGLFCGGPKFGDMNDNRTVITTATGCHFGTYFGAGYGGNSYYRAAPANFSAAGDPWKSTDDKQYNLNWNQWVAGEIKANLNGGKYPGGIDYTGYKQDYISAFGGVSVGIDYQFIPMSNNSTNVARLFIDFVSFSLATTYNVTSNLTGCTITGNFYGGGSLGAVNGPVTSTLTNCTVDGSVFGAGFSASLPTVSVMPTSGFKVEPNYDKNTGVFVPGELPDYEPDVYHWEHAQTVSSTTTAIDKVNHILYTEENLDGLGAVTGDVTLNIMGSTTVAGSVYGGGEESSVDGDTKIMLLGGTVNGDVYGGCKGRLEAGTSGEDDYVEPIEAKVGSTKVNLNGMEKDDYDSTNPDHVELVKAYPDEATGDAIEYYTLKTNNGCVVKGNIFGCNNLNGTPMGDVTVNIYKTKGYEGHIRTGANAETAAAREEALNDIDDSKHSYEVQAVYGGGNLAAYDPDDPDNKHTQVNIYGCGDTSIRQVYGGGNAASTPATQVDVYGTYEIGELFGGGNGKDDISRDGGTTYIKNPGANVGFKDYWDYEKEIDDERFDTKEERESSAFESYIYGTGEAHVNIHGGRIHRVYGGSNTKGNVKTVAVTMLEELNDATGSPCCEFHVDEAYGGGKSAEMDGASRLEMACIPGLKNAYGGAEAADIQSDVTLNITNGNFDRVFGGNNVSGTIHGKITVNIEETGCHLITIGQLFGGGNQAAYEGPEILDSQNQGTGVFRGPTVNAKSFTSIGEIYGGGYGETAKVTGDTEVNINVCDGRVFYTTGENPVVDTAKQAAEEERAANYTGYSDDVADADKGYKVIKFAEFVRTANGGFEYNDDGSRKVVNTEVNIFYPPHTSGAIGSIGAVYGGGYGAEVDGNTHVNIGTQQGETVTFETPTDVTDPEKRKHTVKGASITGNVYGGGNQAVVKGNTNVMIGKESTTTATPAPENTTPDVNAEP